MDLYLIVGASVNGEIYVGKQPVYRTFEDAYAEMVEIAKECRADGLETDWNEDTLRLLVTDEEDNLVETYEIHRTSVDF